MVEKSRGKEIKRTNLHPMMMGNGKGRQTIVVDGDDLMEYVGIGWIKKRKATNQDKKIYPKVID